MSIPSRRDDLVLTVAVIVLLVGTATGSAYVMLGMSVPAIILLAVFYRQHLGAGALLAAFLAAVIAAGIAAVVSMR